MELSTLLKSIYIGSSRNDQELDIKKLAYHSEEVVQDTLFFCIKGYQTDGHQYASLAEELGATAMIVEEFLPHITVPQYLVEDSRIALAALADSFYHHPSQSFTLVGLTGTNGKTTTSYMTNAIFKEYKRKTGLIGTVMVEMNGEVETSNLTTPESLDLHKYFARMRDKNLSHVTMEVSSLALELSRVGHSAFDIVSFTNISRDHIDVHGSFQSYYDAKASLIREAQKGSFAIVNLDEPLLEALENETEATVVSIGIKNKTGHIFVSDINFSDGKPSFTVNVNRPFDTLNGRVQKPISFSVQLATLGIHSVYNALTAIAVGLISGVPILMIQKGMQNFKGVERRFQIIYDEEFMIVDDLCLNENNIESSMSTLSHMNYESLHLIHSIRGNIGAELNKENAQALAKWIPKLKIEKIIVTMSRSHVRTKDIVLKEERDAFLDVMEKAGIEVELHEELDAALSSSLDQVKPGDTIFMSGARGMDFGTKVMLKQLTKKKPYLNETKTSEVLKGKMVGVDESILN